VEKIDNDSDVCVVFFWGGGGFQARDWVGEEGVGDGLGAVGLGGWGWEMG